MSVELGSLPCIHDLLPLLNQPLDIPRPSGKVLVLLRMAPWLWRRVASSRNRRADGSLPRSLDDRLTATTIHHVGGNRPCECLARRRWPHHRPPCPPALPSPTGFICSVSRSTSHSLHIGSTRNLPSSSRSLILPLAAVRQLHRHRQLHTGHITRLGSQPVKQGRVLQLLVLVVLWRKATGLTRCRPEARRPLACSAEKHYPLHYQ